jgi:GxxExxY protein
MLFDVWREIGYSHKEKYIQSAIESVFRKNSIVFERELKTDLKFGNDKIGKYFLDFLVDGKIVLEIKKRDYFSKNDIDQVYSYLKTTGLKLGIISHFTRSGVRFKRILNIN